MMDKQFRIEQRPVHHSTSLADTSANRWIQERVWWSVSKSEFDHSHKKQKDNLKTQVEPVVLCTNIEKQAKLEPIPPYHATKRKQKKEQDSEDCLRTHIFTFLCDYCQFFFIFIFFVKMHTICLGNTN